MGRPGSGGYKYPFHFNTGLGQFFDLLNVCPSPFKGMASAKEIIRSIPQAQVSGHGNIHGLGYFFRITEDELGSGIADDFGIPKLVVKFFFISMEDKGTFEAVFLAIQGSGPTMV